MRITEVTLRRVRCFEEFSIDLEADGGSVLIAGDNGDGKTTLLRSVAMGLCDESSAAALFRELPGKLVRARQDGPAEIEVHLRGRGDEHYMITTRIESLRAFESLQQTVYKFRGRRPIKVDPNAFPWGQIFICAYGAGRQTEGTADAEVYAAVDAVYTLFRYYEPLQNAELSIRRLIDTARKRGGKDPKRAHIRAEEMRKQLVDTLKTVLNLEAKDDVRLTPRGIEVKGRWGKCDLRSCADGYKSVTTWVLDLLAWRMLTKRTYEPKKMTGVVIIDEIEQHLHPKWQLNVMNLLREAFPRIQFIATTHSPLVASGCRHCTVHTLNQGKHEIHRAYGWLAEDVYRRVLGLPTSRADSFQEILEEYERLDMDSLHRTLTKEERGKMRALRSQLTELPESDPVETVIALANLRKGLRNAKNRGTH